MSALMVELELLTVSEANRHEHWRARHKRARMQRHAAAVHTRVALSMRGIKPPCTVKLTRIAPRKLDSDNAVGALKHVRDGVADALGLDDGDERITWLYAQEQATKRYAVRIVIEETES